MSAVTSDPPPGAATTSSRRTSAPAERPNVTTLARHHCALAFSREQNGLSAGMIALQFLSHRLGVVSQAVEQFALWSPGQQLAWRLLSFLRAPDPASVNGMRLNVSQDSLAGMIGRTRQTTNKLLKSLESRGIIALDYGQVTILDIDALRTYLDTESD